MADLKPKILGSVELMTTEYDWMYLDTVGNYMFADGYMCSTTGLHSPNGKKYDLISNSNTQHLYIGNKKFVTYERVNQILYEKLYQMNDDHTVATLISTNQIASDCYTLSTSTVNVDTIDTEVVKIAVCHRAASSGSYKVIIRSININTNSSSTVNTIGPSSTTIQHCHLFCDSGFVYNGIFTSTGYTADNFTLQANAVFKISFVHNGELYIAGYMSNIFYWYIVDVANKTITATYSTPVVVGANNGLLYKPSTKQIILNPIDTSYTISNYMGSFDETNSIFAFDKLNTPFGFQPGTPPPENYVFRHREIWTSDFFAYTLRKTQCIHNTVPYGKGILYNDELLTLTIAEPNVDKYITRLNLNEETFANFDLYLGNTLLAKNSNKSTYRNEPILVNEETGNLSIKFNENNACTSVVAYGYTKTPETP